ncbi:MAG: GNAT family N-acetyltransferase, partial [Caulobacteraceae bacterium]
AEDVARFLSFRRTGLTNDPDAFRILPSDDAAISDEAWRARLERDHVVGVERGGDLVGVGGLSRFTGAKLDHKGLIWGMYVAAAERGSGVAGEIMQALIEIARGQVRQLQLTVMADNARARAFYERHGFELYGIEPQAVRRETGWADEALMWRVL